MLLPLHMPSKWYQASKVVCECGGFTSITPCFREQHEETQKHKRWITEKNGGITTAIVIAHHRKRLPEINNCPCGAVISDSKHKHVETDLHKYYIEFGVQKPLDPTYCHAHRPGTKNPIDTSKCILCSDWHHTKNLLGGKVCRKCI